MESEDDELESSSDKLYLPHHYYTIHMRFITISSGLARIALAIGCLYLEVLAMQHQNVYATQKYTLFWCSFLVLITAVFGVVAGFEVKPCVLKMHSATCLIGVVGTLLQAVYAAHSFTHDGSWSNADPMIARNIMIIAVIQIVLLLFGFGMHVRAFKKDEYVIRRNINKRQTPETSDSDNGGGSEGEPYRRRDIQPALQQSSSVSPPQHHVLSHEPRRPVIHRAYKQIPHREYYARPVIHRAYEQSHSAPPPPPPPPVVCDRLREPRPQGDSPPTYDEAMNYTQFHPK